MCAFLALVATDAIACPACTYERVMPTWVLFASLRLLAVCVIGLAVLDVVRMLEAFVAYEVAYFYAWRLAVWYSHPAVSEGTVAMCSAVLLFALEAGIPAAIVLRGLSRFRHFIRTPGARVSWKRAILVVPAMSLVALAQHVVCWR